MTLKRISKIIFRDSVTPCDLLTVLCNRFTYRTRESWRAEIAAGRIMVNGACGTDEMPLHEGDVIEYLPEMRPEPAVDDRIRVLYNDEDYLVLNKTGNLPCHPGGCFFAHTLWGLLKEGAIDGIPPMSEFHFVSRLDRETSGVILLAKHAKAARQAVRALAMPLSGKTYWVLVEGVFPDTMNADGWLWNVDHSLIAKRRFFGQEAPWDGRNIETAKTFFRCIKRKDGISAVEATLETGRMHQIRATLCSSGYPVVGDKLYGVDETLYLKFISDALTEEDRMRLRVPRQALHARRLRLSLPDRVLTFEAPMPEEWRGLGFDLKN